MSDFDAVLEAFLDDPPRDWLIPAVLRLGRRLPRVQSVLSSRLDDPLDQALLGLAPPPTETTLSRAVLSGLAATDAGRDVPGAVKLAERAQGDATWWVHAAYIAARSSAAYEQAARMRLSEQSLPYVFPGELHQITVDVLSVGDRVMPALHVDWARKLTSLTADALVLDCRALGLWFWPVLRSLSTEKLPRPVAKLARARRMPSGGLGIGAAYAHLVGAPTDPLLAKGTALDQLIAALAVIGDRPG